MSALQWTTTPIESDGWVALYEHGTVTLSKRDKFSIIIYIDPWDDLEDEQSYAEFFTAGTFVLSALDMVVFFDCWTEILLARYLDEEDLLQAIKDNNVPQTIRTKTPWVVIAHNYGISPSLR